MSTAPTQPQPPKRGRPRNAERDAAAKVRALLKPLPADIQAGARAIIRADAGPAEILEAALAVVLSAEAEYLTDRATRLQALAAVRQWASDIQAAALAQRVIAGKPDDPDALRLLGLSRQVDVTPDIRAHQRTLAEFADAKRKLAESLATYQGGGFTRVHVMVEGGPVRDPAAPTSVHVQTPQDAEIIRRVEGSLDE